MTKIDGLTRDAVLNLKHFKSRNTLVTAPPGYAILKYNDVVILEYFPHLNEGAIVQIRVPNVKNRGAILNRINAVLDNFDMRVTPALLGVWYFSSQKDYVLGCLKFDKEYTINLKTKELKCQE